MGTWLSETYRKQKQTYMKKNCVSSWLFTKMTPKCTVRKTYKSRSMLKQKRRTHSRIKNINNIVLHKSEFSLTTPELYYVDFVHF